MSKKELLFSKLADELAFQINNGVLKPGEQLPSLRAISQDKKVSKNTALNAYFELERRGLVASKPRSGYYVARRHQVRRDMPSASRPVQVSADGELAERFAAMYNNSGLSGVNLSSTQLSPELLPIARLNKEIVYATRRLPYGGVQYERYGNEKLKKQIALRSIRWGGGLKPEDVIPTQGCFDAITLCLLTLLKPGDTIGVESPLHFGLINLAQNLGYHILELPTHPDTGIDLQALEQTVRRKKIQLLLLMGNFSNLFGSYMPDEHKREVVRLMTLYNIPLIEDDIYSDFYFGSRYPTFCKTYDEAGIVMWCGSVSKTLAGGYRVGWLAPGRYREQIQKTKPYHPVNCNSITHEAIANFFETNRYDNYLNKLRQTLSANSSCFLQAIHECFPADTRVTRPQGGIQLWVELNSSIDTMALYNTAISNKINIAPGQAFTAQHQYTSSMKLSYGMVWSSKIEQALRTLGRLCGRQHGKAG